MRSLRTASSTFSSILFSGISVSYTHLDARGVFGVTAKELGVRDMVVRGIFAGIFNSGGDNLCADELLSLIHIYPSRRKSCEAGQADALCILCRDVPV